MAYTSGNNIVFNQNQYSPWTDSGKRLLAHELTRTIQETKGTATQSVFRKDKNGINVATEAQPLKSNLLNTPRLQDASRNAPTLRQGSRGDDVKRLQFALRLLGMELEKSFDNNGQPDGKYGPDTATNVRQFQIDEAIAPPGGFEVGERTLHRIDDMLIKSDLDPRVLPVIPVIPINPPTPVLPIPLTVVSCSPEKARSITESVAAAKNILRKQTKELFLIVSKLEMLRS
ncbi:MAG: DUF4157 domain-containing protein [Ignavibacteria bacterium]|nr:DUF4157 domain-containing protein [Ignavibacteria bacterium]